MSRSLPTIHHRSDVVWPWTIGALLIGFPLLIVMPPLALVLIVVLGAFGLAKAARQTGEGRKSLAVASGLLLSTLIYFVLWLVGGIAR